jgi:hypothetical protein
MTRRAHLPILTLLAAALFLRALVPVGWMPVADSGAFAIQPCPAADAAPGPPHHHHRGSPHAGHDGDCAFAPLHTDFGSAGSARLVPLPPAEVDRPLQSAAIASIPTGPPALPPPATGPPAIA